MTGVIRFPRGGRPNKVTKTGSVVAQQRRTTTPGGSSSGATPHATAIAANRQALAVEQALGEQEQARAAAQEQGVTMDGDSLVLEDGGGDKGFRAEEEGNEDEDAGDDEMLDLSEAAGIDNDADNDINDNDGMDAMEDPEMDGMVATDAVSGTDAATGGDAPVAASTAPTAADSMDLNTAAAAAAAAAAVAAAAASASSQVSSSASSNGGVVAVAAASDYIDPAATAAPATNGQQPLSQSQPTQPPRQQAPLPTTTTTAVAPSTTAQMARASGYDHLLVESALAKRLARAPGLRLAQQRRPEQQLNLARRSNVEALFAHIAGAEVTSGGDHSHARGSARGSSSGSIHRGPCKNCHKGHGPWTACVVVDGQMCGSCANCWFNASGARCSFHEAKAPLQPPLQPPLQSHLHGQHVGRPPLGSAAVSGGAGVDMGGVVIDPQLAAQQPSMAPPLPPGSSHLQRHPSTYAHLALAQQQQQQQHNHQRPSQSPGVASTPAAVLPPSLGSYFSSLSTASSSPPSLPSSSAALSALSSLSSLSSFTSLSSPSPSNLGALQLAAAVTGGGGLPSEQANGTAAATGTGHANGTANAGNTANGDASASSSASSVLGLVIDLALAEVRNADRQTRDLMLVEIAAKQLALAIVQYSEGVANNGSSSGNNETAAATTAAAGSNGASEVDKQQQQQPQSGQEGPETQSAGEESQLNSGQLTTDGTA